MLSFTLPAVFVLALFLQNGLTLFIPDSAPDFPSLDGDITVTGVMKHQDQSVHIHFKAWLSEEREAARVDIKGEFGGILINTKTLILGKEGEHGRYVSVDPPTGECEYKVGTEDDPYMYEVIPMILTWDQKYVGKVTEDGVEYDKWKSKIPNAYGFTVYVRQTSDGPVPAKIEVQDITIEFTSMSRSSIPASAFRYNTKDCLEVVDADGEDEDEDEDERTGLLKFFRKF